MKCIQALLYPCKILYHLNCIQDYYPAVHCHKVSQYPSALYPSILVCQLYRIQAIPAIRHQPQHPAPRLPSPQPTQPPAYPACPQYPPLPQQGTQIFLNRKSNKSTKFCVIRVRASPRLPLLSLLLPIPLSPPPHPSSPHLPPPPPG